MSCVSEFKDDLEWLKITLRHGGNPNMLPTKNRFCPKQTPIFCAISEKNTEAVEMLIAAGADIEHKNHLGENPLAFARKHCCYDIIYLLLKSGADYHSKGPGYRSEDGLGNDIAIEILDDIAMASKNIPPDHEWRPWMSKIVQFLEEKGVKRASDKSSN